MIVSPLTSQLYASSSLRAFLNFLEVHVVVSVGVNVFFGGEGGFGIFFLDFLEDFFFLDLFLSLTYDVDEEDSELEEYQLCLEVEDELLESPESDEDGSEGFYW